MSLGRAPIVSISDPYVGRRVTEKGECRFRNLIGEGADFSHVRYLLGLTRMGCLNDLH